MKKLLLLTVFAVAPMFAQSAGPLGPPDPLPNTCANYPNSCDVCPSISNGIRPGPTSEMVTFDAEAARRRMVAVAVALTVVWGS